MVFNSLTFLVFASVFFPLYFAAKGRWRWAVCLTASLIFYGWWDWRFLGLILFVAVVDYTLGRLLEKMDDDAKDSIWLQADLEKRRKRLIFISVCMNLGFLGFFKYFNFFIDSFARLIGSDPNSWALHIILPVGISFYTFQSMSYTIDVYRREIKAERDFFKFATFVSLWPQLVAGPIVRARDFLPQFSRDHDWDTRRVLSGLGRVLWGFFKKVAIADSIAPFVDQCFQAPATFSSMHLLIGVVFYSFQIYCDFSGYTDIAIGFARIMGFRFIENFRTPYFSQSFSEFWTRWHISLSSWLRDYLYIPLGGNRGGKWGTYRNNMLTMLLGGLWHGANLAFIFWGFLHGAYLILQRVFSPGWRKFVAAVRMPKPLEAGILMFVCYFLTCFAWIYFRAGAMGATSFDVANQVISGIGSLDGFSFSTVVNKFQVMKGMILIGILLAVEVSNFRFGYNSAQVENPIFRLVAYSILLWLIAFFGTFGSNAFIYFQF